jgi:hypothetical protein
LAGPHVAPSPVKQPDTHVDNPGSATAWSISKVPDPWVVSTWLPASRCTAFSVTTKDSQATHVRVYSTLVEQTTKQAITMGDLQLCRLGERCSGGQQLQPLNAKATTDLQICTRAAFHGTYHGAVVLASQEKPQGDTILQTAQFSSFAAKLAGCLLIFAGVYLAWWSKVWSRARIERDQALMPVVLMRSQLAALQQAATPARSYGARPARHGQPIGSAQRSGPPSPGSIAARTSGSGGPPKESRRSWKSRQARPGAAASQSWRSLRMISLPSV